jgi:hypothetical protein
MAKPDWRGTQDTEPEMVETRLHRIETIMPNVWRGQPTHTRSRYDALQRGTLVPDSSLAPVATEGTYNSLTGQMTVSSPLNHQGSLVNDQAVLLSYTTTATSISITWSDQTLMRMDGTVLIFHAGSQSYTGLSPSTAYYVYPYIRTSDGAGQFANGSPPPTSPNAVTAVQTGLDGRISILTMKITTPASGSGGGTGGGGDICPEGGEIVETKVGNKKASEVVAGDLISGRITTTGEKVFRMVFSTRSEPCAAWVIVKGHRVSPCEPIWWEGKWTQAFRVPGAVRDRSIGKKIMISVAADEYDEANYELVSGDPLLIHNVRVPC